MFRYCAIVWSTAQEADNDLVASLHARLLADTGSWRLEYLRDGLRVYCAGSRASSSAPIHLGAEVGLVMGTLFSRPDESGCAQRKTEFHAVEIERIRRSSGRSLTQDYWGRYVAFLFSPTDESVRVLRSPTGELDCLHSMVGGAHVFFSALEHLPFPDLLDASVDWEYISASIATMVPETRQTGFSAVHRLLRGECLTIRNGRPKRDRYWNAVAFAMEPPIEEPATAAKILRTTTCAAVQAWGSCYRSILLMLSGGLDSSILAGLLANSPHSSKLTCVNYRTPGEKVSDERRYARIVAARAKRTLLEHEYDRVLELRRLLQLPRMAVPYSSVHELGVDRHRREITAQYQVDAYFVGHGGDEVFLLNAADFMCADIVRRRGASWRLIPTALAAARIRGDSLANMIRLGLRDGKTADAISVIARRFAISPLVEQGVAETIRARRIFIPQWLLEASDMPPGKIWQILTLCPDTTLYSPLDGAAAPEVVNPLHSQPIQELCLRIPSYTTAFQGISRGLAREAFKSVVPVEILERRDKGTIATYFKAVWQSNLPFVRDLLLNGALIQNRIVDKRKVELALAGDFGRDLGTSLDLISMAGVEAWLQRSPVATDRVAA